MEGLVRDRIISADVVKAGHGGLAAQLMNQFALPEEHHVLLVLSSLLNFSSIHLSSLLLLHLEDLSESSRPELFNDLEPAVKDLLTLLKIVLCHLLLFII